MKHVFIVNPASGSSDPTEGIRAELEKLTGVDWEIYVTKAPKDATEHVKEVLEKDAETEYRFYACGGDGTLNEVVNGAVGFKNASVSCYPCGSGNDFVKYYGSKDRFLNVEKLVNAENKEIDLMKAGDMYAINVTNFGFDTTVAKTISKVKTKPLLGGKMAYTCGIVRALITSMKNRGRIVVDGEEFYNGNYLLCTIANGNYVGGSFKCAPRSLNDDGLMEICLVKTISRFRFVKLLGPYTEGKHLDDPQFSDCLIYRRGRTIEISSDQKNFAISVDGEIVETPYMKVETVGKALRFAVPEE